MKSWYQKLEIFLRELVSNATMSKENRTGGGEYKVLYNNPPSGYIGLGLGQQTKKGLVFGLDFGLLYGPGPIITGPDEGKIESIRNSSVAGKVLPNIQFSLGFNFD